MARSAKPHRSAPLSPPEIAALSRRDPEDLARQASAWREPERQAAWLEGLRRAREGDERALSSLLLRSTPFSLPWQNPNPGVDEALIGPGADLLKLIASESLSPALIDLLAQASASCAADAETSMAGFAALCQAASPSLLLRAPQARRNALGGLSPIGLFGAIHPACCHALAHARNLPELALEGVFDHPFWRSDLRHARSLSQDAPTGACSFLSSLLRENDRLSPRAAAQAALIFQRSARQSETEMAWIASALALRRDNEAAISLAIALFEQPPPELARKPEFARAFEARDIAEAIEAPARAPARRNTL